MTAIRKIARLFSPAYLAGPIFEKELRVSSRRKRTYALRLIYMLLLTGFVAIVWSTVGRFSRAMSSSSLVISRMAEVGKAVAVSVIYFQFIAMQLIAMVLCSSAISEEITKRTLGVLMTTPITSLQIVVGKMLSRLLQLFLLLCLSLPLLGVIRVFGGVPWDFCLAGLAITVTAMLFAGSISLFFSIGSRHAYSAILRSFLTGFLYYAILPAVVGLLVLWVLGPSVAGVLGMALLVLNPFAMLTMQTGQAMSPAALGMPSYLTWPVHCGLMLVLSGLILTWCAARVRKVALQQIVGEVASPNAFLPPMPVQRMTVAMPVGMPVDMGPEGPGATGNLPASVSAGPTLADKLPVAHRTGAEDGPAHGFDDSSLRDVGIRPVSNSPVAWKELRAPLFRRTPRNIVVAAVFVLVLLAMYSLAARDDGLRSEIPHAVFAVLYLIAALIDFAVLSATCITTEKEAGTWPILLTTSLTAWQIVSGKMLGIIRRTAPMALFLFGHLVVFVLVGYIHPVALLLIGMLWAFLVVFLSACGIFFSTMFRKTTAAVVANMALCLAIWVVIPSALPFIFMGSARESAVIRAVLGGNPVYLCGMIMTGASGQTHAAARASELAFAGGFGKGPDNVFQMFGWLVLIGMAHITVAIILLVEACRRLRRGVF